MKKFYTLSATLLFCSIISYSQPGTLDVSFGQGGKVNTNIIDVNKGGENINAVAIQADGKIVVAGSTMSPGFIFRYNADGTLDNSFDNDGMLFVWAYKFTCLAIQPDGKILAAGNNFGMVRLNSNGSFDNSFGSNGRLLANIGAYYSGANAMCLQADGKIVLGGYTYDGARNQFALARFNSNGSPDNSFDGDGQVITDFGPAEDEIRGLALQSDGKIVVNGYMYNGAGANMFAIARYNVNGSLDNTFDTDGKLSLSFGTPDDYGSSIAVQTDGKIIVTGFTSHDLAIARLTGTGTLDNTFDTDGKLVTPTSSSTIYPATILLTGSGKILVTASTGDSYGVYRYNSNGSPDNSFDGDGMVTTDIGSDVDYPTCVAVQSSGRIVVGGFSLNVYNRDYSIACYNDNGSLDNSFHGNGKLVGYFNTSYDIPLAAAIQNDGKVVLAGYSGLVDLGTNNDFALARYNANGTLDNSFNGNGKVTTAIGSSNDQVYAIAIQTDGKIVAVGRSLGPLAYDVSVARYNTNGTLDNTFDGDGKLMFSVTVGNDIASAVTIQTDGKIVIAGTNLVARLNSNGTLDNSFDGDGLVTTTVGGTVSMVLQSDGKIVVAGSNGSDFMIARYGTNGAIDNSFDGDGIVTTDINGGSTDVIKSIALQSDGKIVVAGLSNSDFAVARYNSNGSPDNTFDGDGKLITTGMVGTSGGIKVASVGIQSNGKIVVAGETRNANDDYILVRYNIDGGLDNTFDTDGKLTLDLGPNSYEHLWAMSINSNRIYLAGESLTEGAVDFILAAIVSEPSAGPLPLQLRDFSGKRLNTDALLTWKTENESEMLEYVVERSLDGRSYTDVGTARAQNRAGIYNYYFTDYNITSLNVAVVYYRLRENGIDGKFAYSNIIALPLDKNKNIVLFYPNPVINEANVALTVRRQDKLLVRIIDNNGRLVRQQQWNVSAGSTSLSIDVQNLASGMYYLEIKGQDIDYRKQFVK